MSIFRYSIEKTIGGHFLTKISVNSERYRESLADARGTILGVPVILAPDNI